MIKHAIIYKQDLPSAYTVKHVNLWIMNTYRRAKGKRKKRASVYEMHGMTFKEMRRFILSPERDEDIEKINTNLLLRGDIFSQSAYYFRAFSKSQIFLDANHRTGFFCLRQIVRGKGYDIKADAEEVQSLGNYLKSHFYIHQGEIVIELRKKDEVYKVILDWLRQNLDFR